MKNAVLVSWLILIFLWFMAQTEKALGGIMVYEDQTAFLADAGTVEHQTFTVDTGDLDISGSNPGFQPFVSGGKVVIPADGGVFQATAIFAPLPLTMFGIHVDNAGSGVLALFIDGDLEWVRRDNENSFFIGVIGNPFDLFAISANIGQFELDDALYNSVPELSSFLMLGAGLYCIIGARNGFGHN